MCAISKHAVQKGKLSAYHADADDLFLQWSNIWLSPEFRRNIVEPSQISTPLLIIQGEDDQ